MGHLLAADAAACRVDGPEKRREEEPRLDLVVARDADRAAKTWGKGRFQLPRCSRGESLDVEARPGLIVPQLGKVRGIGPIVGDHQRAVGAVPGGQIGVAADQID